MFIDYYTFIQNPIVYPKNPPIFQKISSDVLTVRMTRILKTRFRLTLNFTYLMENSVQTIKL